MPEVLEERMVHMVISILRQSVLRIVLLQVPLVDDTPISADVLA